VSGRDREALFQIAEAVILPSHSENFGIVIGEAMARGKPVVTSPYVPWQSLEANGAGWICEPTPTALAETLHTALKQPPEALRAMGERGRQSLANQFGWHDIGAHMHTFYRYIRKEIQTCDCLFRE
jgi:glycosyltransferase involved in cell wall biosynthesis